MLPKIFRMADMEAGTGGSESSDAVSDGTIDGAMQSGGAEIGGKPTYLDDKFWNPDTKEADLEGLSNSYAELGSKIRSKSEDMKAGFMEELESEKVARRPETQEGYEVRVPESISESMPEGMDFEFSDTDPMLTFWKEFSFEQGYDQSTFESGVAAYINSSFSNMPDFGEEIEKLGDNGRDRAQHVNLWAEKNLSPESYKSLESFAVTADGVIALEEVMRMSGEPQFSPGGPAGVGSNVTLDELRKMQADPRYWDPNKIEADFVRKVDQGYEKLVS
tara:strand:+ start:14720 stop:15547 length:828 start_codon:yes stop_codon:yes gene_type:complete